MRVGILKGSLRGKRGTIVEAKQVFALVRLDGGDLHWVRVVYLMPCGEGRRRVKEARGGVGGYGGSVNGVEGL